MNYLYVILVNTCEEQCVLKMATHSVANSHGFCSLLTKYFKMFTAAALIIKFRLMQHIHCTIEYSLSLKPTDVTKESIFKMHGNNNFFLLR